MNDIKSMAYDAYVWIKVNRLASVLFVATVFAVAIVFMAIGFADGRGMVKEVACVDTVPLIIERDAAVADARKNSFSAMANSIELATVKDQLSKANQTLLHTEDTVTAHVSRIADMKDKIASLEEKVREAEKRVQRAYTFRRSAKRSNGKAAK